MGSHITLETANMLCSAAMAFVETMPEKKGDEFSHMLTRLMRDKDAAGKAIQMAGRFEKEFSPHKEGAVEALAAVSMLASSLIVAITKVYGKENTSPMIFQFLEVLYDNLDDMSKEAGVDCPKGITDRVMIRAEGPAPDQTMQ